MNKEYEFITVTKYMNSHDHMIMWVDEFIALSTLMDYENSYVRVGI